MLRLPPIATIVVILACLPLFGCSSIQGYPHDPEDESATLSSLQAYFSPDIDNAYYEISDETARRRLRDRIVLNRIRAFDIEFNKFAQSLTSDRSGVTVASDLAVLALNGVGATAGGATTKAALAAASAGIVGAQGSISKDLFYDRTIPALITQIQTNRTRVKASIIDGLSHNDAEYSLALAYLDLDALKNAGNLSSAISEITQQAASSREFVQSQLDDLRHVKFVSSSSSQAITRWLFKGTTQIDVARRASLTAWIKQNVGDIPFQTFISASTLESNRQNAIAALHMT